jgi:hypothetical protein
MNLPLQPKAVARSLFCAGFLVTTLFLAGPAKGQSIVLDFKFDTNGGPNPSVFGSSNVNLTPGTAGQTYTVDIWATINSAASQAASNFGLQSIAMRGSSDASANTAFATGAGIGVVSGSFAELSPFNPPGFAQPAVTDLGKTSNGGSSITSGADGISDFGGTITVQRLTIASNTGGPQYGTGADASSYTWELGTFKFTIGTPGSASGAVTKFWPTLLTPGQGAASADAFTAVGGAATSGATTLTINPLTFTVVPAAGTTISVASDAAAASVLKGGSIGLGSTITNTGGTALAAGGYNFTASGGTAIGYNPANANTAALAASPGPGNSSHSVFTASTTPGPGGTPIGIATVTFTGSDNGSGTITNSPQTATTQLNVGGAIADNTNVAGVYGPPISAVVGPSGSYAGLESAVVGLQGAGGSNAANTPFAPPWLGGDAKILAGSSTSATARTVSMAWRTRLVGAPTGGQLSETHGGAGSALQATTATTGLVSDVVNLTGLELSGQPAPGPTDPFVLDMTYNPALLPKAGAVEATLAKNKLIYMVSPVPGPDNGVSQYANTVALNTGNVIVNPLDNRYGYQGSYAAFQADPLGGNGGTPASELGAWGIDIATHEVWAVANHNSTFAVVPEPATILLAGLGLLGLFGLRRAKKA